MRSTPASASVRLYWLDDGDPVAETLFSGPPAEAMAIAATQPPAVQAGLWIATDNAVVAYADLAADTICRHGRDNAPIAQLDRARAF